MKRLLLSLIFFIPLLSNAQLTVLPISIDADYAVFQMNDSLSYVEFYTSVFQGNLNYKSQNDSLISNFDCTLKISKDGKEIHSIKHIFKSTLEDSSKFTEYNMLNDIFALSLKPGKYSATVLLNDMNSGTKGEYAQDIIVPDFSGHFKLSNIEFASKIKRATKKTKFVKNGLEIIPYSRNQFDLIQPMLYYYVELNNLKVENNNQYRFNYFITKANGDTVKQGKEKIKNITNSLHAEVGGFNALSLPGGRYTFNISVFDIAQNQQQTTKKDFFVTKLAKKKKQDIASLPKIAPHYQGMIGAEIEEEFSTCKYLLEGEELKTWDNLENLDAKRAYLTDFWNKRDQKLRVPFGTSRNNTLELKQIATEKWGNSVLKGWKTDRGRIFITYGRPNEIDRDDSSLETKPYEVWSYHKIEGGVIFVFADLNGFGRYELIHSSYRKELSDPNWKRRIDKSNSGGMQNNLGF